MLDKDVEIEVREKAEYPPLPKNIYQVELLDINSERRPTYETRLKAEDEQKLETVLSFQFVLLEGKDDETELRGRNVWANFIPCYFYEGRRGKNKLMKIVEAFTGIPIDMKSPEIKSFKVKDLNGYVGQQIRVSLEPQTKGDKTYDTIVDYLIGGTDLEILTEEEKEKATVKRKDDDDSITVETMPDKEGAMKDIEDVL